MVNSKVLDLDGRELRVRNKKGPRRNRRYLTQEEVEAERLAVLRHSIMGSLQTSKRPLDVELVLRQNMALLEPMHIVQALQQLIEVASVYHPDIGGAIAIMEEAFVKCLPKFRPAQIAAGVQALAKVYDYRPSPQLLKALVQQLLNCRSGIMPPHVLPLLDFFAYYEYRNKELYRHLYELSVANLHVYTVAELSTILFAMCHVEGDPPGALAPLIDSLHQQVATWIEHPELKGLPENKLFIARDAPKLLWTLSTLEGQSADVMGLLLKFTAEGWDKVLPHYQLMALSGALHTQTACWEDVRLMLEQMRENLHQFKPAQLVELLEINQRPRSPEQKELLDAVVKFLPIYLGGFTAEQLLCVLRLAQQCKRVDAEAVAKLQEAISTHMGTIADQSDSACVEELLVWQMENGKVDVALADRASSAVMHGGAYRRFIWVQLAAYLHSEEQRETAERIERKLGLKGQS